MRKRRAKIDLPIMILLAFFVVKPMVLYGFMMSTGRFGKVRFSNFEGADKERPEPPQIIRAASLSPAVRKNTFCSSFFCVFVFDAKCKKQEVARGAGPHRTKTKPPKTKQLSVQITVFSHFEINQQNCEIYANVEILWEGGGVVVECVRSWRNAAERVGSCLGSREG